MAAGAPDEGSFVAAFRLAAKFGSAFQKQLDQIETIPALELIRTCQDFTNLNGEIT